MLRWLFSLLLAAAVLFLLYVLNCGINYRRVSFSEHTKITIEGYTAEELKEVCLWLTDEVNKRKDQVMRSEDGQMMLTVSERDTAVKEMHNLGEQYPVLKGYYPLPKGLMISEILSFQGLTGVYSPFTIEANYNQDMTAYNIPFTVCHELSHLRGFMQEEEANFIAFLACSESDSVDFQYSGYLLGWIYGMNELKRIDEDAWEELRIMLEEKIEADLRANSDFWNTYEGKVMEISNEVNDAYLKANGQESGVKSYDRMVDLLVAYYQKKVYS